MSIIRSQGNRGGKRLVSDINVTPLVDVMLVLLIIFMVTAPMMTQGIDLDLRETTDAPPPRQQNDQPLVISISKDGQIKLNDSDKSHEDLMQELARIPEEEKKNRMLVIRADRGVSYGLVAALFADARNAGFRNLTPAIR